MNRITISKSDFKVETTSTWLASVLQFALDIDYLASLQAFKLKMKEAKSKPDYVQWCFLV